MLDSIGYPGHIQKDDSKRLICKHAGPLVQLILTVHFPLNLQRGTRILNPIKHANADVIIAKYSGNVVITGGYDLQWCLHSIFMQKASQSARQHRDRLLLNNTKREAKKYTFTPMLLTGHLYFFGPARGPCRPAVDHRVKVTVFRNLEPLACLESSKNHRPGYN